MNLKEIQKQVSLLKINNAVNAHKALTLCKKAINEIELLDLSIEEKMNLKDRLKKVPALVDQYNKTTGTDFSIGDILIFTEIVNTVYDSLDGLS